MMKKKSTELLMRAAMSAREKAYAPYSRFAVGAAVQSGNGQIFSGCNVENASYGLTNCAERTAIFNAISAGETELIRLLVVADTCGPVAPCGACRQVMKEFDIQEIILCNTSGESKTFQMEELLPYAFGPEQEKGATGNE